MTGPSADPLVLGIETSCDETSAAVLRGDRELLGHVILTQDVHSVYGGVVPELAAREHIRRIDDVVAAAFREAGCAPTHLDAVAVTTGPGLIGPLLVGAAWARGFALGIDRPVLPVHHMEAHLFAPSIEDPEAEPPFVALLVSGGHTLIVHAEAWGSYRVLGTTRDDAAGEAYDKVAKALGLPYPGGPALEAAAGRGDASRHPFPRPLLSRADEPDSPDYFDLSFSGLKTAVARVIESHRRAGDLEEELPHIAAGFQEAVVDVLTAKVARAVDWTGCRRVLLGGGVSANRGVRRAAADLVAPDGRLFTGSVRLSLDNGAMIARAAVEAMRRGGVHDRDPRGTHSVDPNRPFPGVRGIQIPSDERTNGATRGTHP